MAQRNQGFEEGQRTQFENKMKTLTDREKADKKKDKEREMASTTSSVNLESLSAP